MQVILLERVEKLGKIGDEVKVKRGFARNFLIPQGKALVANDKNRARFERERETIEARNASARAAAETQSAKIDGQTFILIRQAGDTGQLYGSVSTRDISTAAADAGQDVPRAAIRLDKPIKTIGIFDVSVRLHPEVASTVRVNVARTPDEAERQSKGEDIIASLQAAQTQLDNEQASELADAAAQRAADGQVEED